MKKYLLMLVMACALVACGQGPDPIQTIKSSSFNNCSTKTVGQMIDNFFESPTWKMVKVENKEYASVSGTINHNGTAVPAYLRFSFNEFSVFRVIEFTLDGVAQDEDMIKELLNSMCGQ